jgi:hypothetical protein
VALKGTRNCTDVSIDWNKHLRSQQKDFYYSGAASGYESSTISFSSYKVSRKTLFKKSTKVFLREKLLSST